MSHHQTVIFEARNKHSEDCGDPPYILSAPGAFTSYFENEHGEQWICYSEDGKLLVRGGDAGWEKSYPVEPTGNVTGLILSNIEHMWLIACATAWEVKRR